MVRKFVLGLVLPVSLFAKILFVAPETTYYSDLFDTLGLAYDYVHIDSVTSSILSGYDFCVWASFTRYKNTVDTLSLKDWLGLGKKLLITGQDIGYDIGNTGFYKNYLRALYLQDKPPYQDTLIRGIDFPLLDITSRLANEYPSLIDTNNGSEPLFSYCGAIGDSFCGVHYFGEYNLVYLAFSLEGAKEREEIFARLISFLYDTLYPYVENPSLRYKNVWLPDPGDTLWLSCKFFNTNTLFCVVNDSDTCCMYDDGTNGDTLAGDSIYTTFYVTSSIPQDYRIVFVGLKDTFRMLRIRHTTTKKPKIELQGNLKHFVHRGDTFVDTFFVINKGSANLIFHCSSDTIYNIVHKEDKGTGFRMTGLFRYYNDSIVTFIPELGNYGVSGGNFSTAWLPRIPKSSYRVVVNHRYDLGSGDYIGVGSSTKSGSGSGVDTFYCDTVTLTFQKDGVDDAHRGWRIANILVEELNFYSHKIDTVLPGDTLPLIVSLPTYSWQNDTHVLDIKVSSNDSNNPFVTMSCSIIVYDTLPPNLVCEVDTGDTFVGLAILTASCGVVDSIKLDTQNLSSAPCDTLFLPIKTEKYSYYEWVLHSFIDTFKTICTLRCTTYGIFIQDTTFYDTGYENEILEDTFQLNITGLGTYNFVISFDLDSVVIPTASISGAYKYSKAPLTLKLASTILPSGYDSSYMFYETKYTFVAPTTSPYYLDDEEVLLISLPWGINFYDKNFNTCYVSSNGYISFVTSGSYYSRQRLPSQYAPDYSICIFWTDLDSGTAFYYDTTRKDTIVFLFSNAHLYNDGGDYTFEILLLRDGDFIFTYKDMSPPIDKASIGLQCNDTLGLQCAYDSLFAYPQKSYYFEHKETWAHYPKEDTLSKAYGGLPCKFELQDYGTYHGHFTLVGDTVYKIKVVLHVEDTTPPEKPVLIYPRNEWTRGCFVWHKVNDAYKYHFYAVSNIDTIDTLLQDTGYWILDSTEAKYTYSVSAIDYAGNESDTATSVAKVDNIAPPAPIFITHRFTPKDTIFWYAIDSIVEYRTKLDRDTVWVIRKDTSFVLSYEDTFGVSVIALDSALNVSDTAYKVFFYDKTPPVTPDILNDRFLNTSWVTIRWQTGTSVAPLFYRVIVDSDTQVVVVDTLALHFANGHHKVKVSAFDSCGNASETLKVLLVDTILPTVPEFVSPCTLYNDTYIVWHSVIDTFFKNYRVKIFPDSGIFTDTQCLDTIFKLPNPVLYATYSCSLFAVDSCGNTSYNFKKFWFTDDTTPPATPIILTGNLTNKGIYWHTAYDNKGIKYYIVSFKYEGEIIYDTIVDTFYNELPCDTIKFYVKAVDYAGFSSGCDSITTIYDTIPPIVFAENVITDTNIPFRYRVEDLTPVKYYAIISDTFYDTIVSFNPVLGTTYVVVHAEDTFGYTSEKCYHYIFDTTCPLILVDTLKYACDTISFGFGVYDYTSLYVKFILQDDTTLLTRDTDGMYYTPPVFDANEVRYTILAEDTFKHSALRSGRVVFDFEPPLITIFAKNYYNDEVFIKYEVYDKTPCHHKGFIIDTVCTLTFQDSIRMQLQEGTYVLKIFARDTAGNEKETLSTFVVDTTPPGVPELVFPKDTAINTLTPTFVWQTYPPADSYIIILWTPDSEMNYKTDTTSFTTTLWEDTFNYYIVAYDLAQNTSYSNTTQFIIDTTPPEKPVIYIEDTVFSATGEFKIYFSSVAPQYFVCIDTAKYTTHDTVFNTYLQEGLHKYFVIGCDLAGNQAYSDTHYFVSDFTYPKFCDVTIIRDTNDTGPFVLHCVIYEDWLSNAFLYYFTEKDTSYIESRMHKVNDTLYCDTIPSAHQYVGYYYLAVDKVGHKTTSPDNAPTKKYFFTITGIQEDFLLVGKDYLIIPCPILRLPIRYRFKEKTKISIYDIVGRKVLEKELKGKGNLRLDLSQGIYFLKAKEKVYKVVILK